MLDFANLWAVCDLHSSRLGRLPMWPIDRLEDRPSFFDRQGFPIPSVDGAEPALVWGRLFEHTDRTIGMDELPDGSYLSTVWLGCDHALVGPPLLYETMRFKGTGRESRFWKGREERDVLDFPDPETDEPVDQLRYRTEEEAAAAHHEIVRRLRLREGH